MCRCWEIDVSTECRCWEIDVSTECRCWEIDVSTECRCSEMKCVLVWFAAKYSHVLWESGRKRVTLLARGHGRTTLYVTTGQSREDGRVSAGQGSQGRTARGGKG